MPYPSRGVGGGAGFQLFIQSDNSQGIYADAAARNTYFAANQSEVDRLARNEFLIIRLDDNGSGDVAYQQYTGAEGSYVSADWVDVTSLVQGDTGPAGATGNSYFFKSLADRDAFFTIAANHQLLETDLPVQVNTGENRVSVFVWTGIDNPVTYNSSQFELASVRSGTGSFYLADAHRISSSGENVAFENIATGVSYHPVWQTFEEGNSGTVRVRGSDITVTVSDKTADLTNPTWSQPATSGDQTIVSSVVDLTNPVIGLNISVNINGVPFWNETFGDLTSGEQALVFNPPLDVKLGQVLTLTAKASTGDVVVKGNSGTGQPYQRATIKLWEDKQIALAEDSKPSIHGLFSDIPSRVNLDTDLNVPHNFTFNVSDYSQFTALELIVNSGTDQALTIPTSNGVQSQSVTLQGIDTSSQGSVSFQLRGTYSGGVVVSNTITVQVRNLAPHEFTYINSQVDQVSANFTTTRANSAEYLASQTLSIPVFTGSEYVVIGQPASENDITSLFIGGLDQIGTFTKSPDTALINGVAYEFYFSNNLLLGTVVSNVQITITRG